MRASTHAITLVYGRRPFSPCSECPVALPEINGICRIEYAVSIPSAVKSVVRRCCKTMKCKPCEVIKGIEIIQNRMTTGGRSVYYFHNLAIPDKGESACSAGSNLFNSIVK